jgi:hypothetical protein
MDETEEEMEMISNWFANSSGTAIAFLAFLALAAWLGHRQGKKSTEPSAAAEVFGRIGEDDQDDGNEDSTSLTPLKTLPICPHCRAVLNKICWAELEDITIFYCPACRALLNCR